MVGLLQVHDIAKSKFGETFYAKFLQAPENCRLGCSRYGGGAMEQNPTFAIN
jgi:hypothetical protein